jgi:ElaB/YqjD/DUF883 family membrane-anchored ribosome-binding protein
MTDHVTTQRLKDDLSTVLRDAEALIKASAEHGGEKTAEARAKIRESLDAAKRRLQEAERAAVRHGEDPCTRLRTTRDAIRGRPWAWPQASDS